LLIFGAALRAVDDERFVEELVPAAAVRSLERLPDDIAAPRPAAPERSLALGDVAVLALSDERVPAELDELAGELMPAEPPDWLAIALPPLALPPLVSLAVVRWSFIQLHAAVSIAKLSGAMSHPRMIRTPFGGCESDPIVGAARGWR
jgi:hypothetical protein